METFRTELTEKKAEIEAMQNSKKTFADRKSSGDLSSFGKEFLNAKLLGAVTNKGFDTDYGRGVMEKAGVDVADAASGLNTIISNQFIEQVSYAQQLGGLFDELAVTSGKTVLPIAKTPKAACV